ncbi:MAG: hypothetical protein M1825_004089 [Sarcosagium campestre]|nr:MAG: hypothetical protein M1825_004089 [Sarcosagium campestre]
MTVPIGFSVGDVVALGKLIHNVVTALKKSRGAASDYTSLLVALSSLHQSIQACSAVFVSRSFDSDSSAVVDSKTPILNGLVYEVKCCTLLLEDFLLSSRKYAESLLNCPPRKKFKDEWRKVVWFIYKTEDVTKLERDLRSHIQAFQLYTLALMSQSAHRIEDVLEKGTQANQVIEGRLAEMFGMVKTLVNAVPKDLGYTWEGGTLPSERPLLFQDALGRSMRVPLMLCATPETFHDILLVMFKNLPGRDHVNRKQYQLQDSSETPLDALVWEDVVRPGSTMNMNVLLQLSSARPTARTCPKCGATNNQYNKSQRMIQCYHCQLRFEIIEKEKIVELVEPSRPRIRSNSEDKGWKAGQAPKPVRRTSSGTKVPKKQPREQDPFKRISFIHENVVLQRRASQDSPEMPSSRRPSLKPSESHSLLQRAEFGDIEGVQSWLDEGGDINLTDEDGVSLLQVAARSGNEQLVQRLLNNDVDTDIQGGHWGNALQAAAATASASSAAMVKMLLENGASPHSQGGYYGSALQAAAAFCGQQGDGEVMEILLEYGADVNVQGGAYGSALQVLAFKGEADIIELLLGYDVDLDAQGGSWGSALQAAAGTSYVGGTDAMRILLESGADANVRGGQSGSALHEAVFRGKKDRSSLLLDFGADINIRAEDGKTALHVAAENGDVSMVEFLLTRGANRDLKDWLDRTAEDLAVKNRHSDLATILEQ